MHHFVKELLSSRNVSFLFNIDDVKIYRQYDRDARKNLFQEAINVVWSWPKRIRGDSLPFK